MLHAIHKMCDTYDMQELGIQMKKCIFKKKPVIKLINAGVFSENMIPCQNAYFEVIFI